ncbi:hypothetical protein EMIHUDRAFT_122153, partial [Emiliania huxleyi CCMP1516]|uniref:Uncharacterized protein n=2 Tax=Emiliania huxleyi TaxID=2903 RepID=A0A0D3KSW2_EMIH1
MELHSTSDEGRRDGIYNQREHGRRGSLSRAAPQRLVGGSSAAASNGDRMEVDEEPPSLSSAPAEPAQQQQQQQASVLTLVADIGRLELEEVGHRAAAREAITATTGTQTSGVPTPRELRAQARLDLQVVGLREEERRRQRLHAAATTRLVRELALKLSNPLRHFGWGAFIQLMMCEFVMRPEVQGRSGRSLGVAFRSQLLLVYEPSDVPTLPGLYSLDVLQASLNTPLLQRAALQAIDDVKLFSLHLPGVLGKVEPTEADSLLGLWQRAAEVRAAEARRPQRGRPRNRIEYALRQNMTGNRYSAALRKAVYLYRHKSGTERSISMRGAASLARDGATLLFDISDDDIARVRLPSAGTCSLIDRAVHRVQRMQEAGSSTVSSEAGLGISWTELEPTLYGRATQRRSSCPVPTDRYDEHLNDIIVHNMQDLSPWADSQDVQARAPISGMTIRAGSLFNRFKSGAPTGWVAKLFAGEAPTERKLVMQRFTDGSEFGGHWHQLLFFVDQRR